MAVDPIRTSKWHPVYSGPHVIGTVHSGGTFTLLDALGQSMEPRRTADMLHLVSHSLSMDAPSGGEERIITPPKTTLEITGNAKIDKENVSYEVECILDQRIRKGKQQYLVHWKGYPKEEATWEPIENFDDLGIVNRFWKSREKKQNEEASAQQPRRSTRNATKTSKK
jgi:hypothetical protein